MINHVHTLKQIKLLNRTKLKDSFVDVRIKSDLLHFQFIKLNVGTQIISKQQHPESDILQTEMLTGFHLSRVRL